MTISTSFSDVRYSSNDFLFFSLSNPPGIFLSLLPAPQQALLNFDIEKAYNALYKTEQEKAREAAIAAEESSTDEEEAEDEAIVDDEEDDEDDEDIDSDDESEEETDEQTDDEDEVSEVSPAGYTA